MAYVTLAIEGGLFPADLLERVALGDVEGQRAGDFGLAAGARLSDAIQAEFSDLCAYWDAFQRRLAHSRESSTRLTREAFAIPLLESLGYQLRFQRAAAQVGDQSYAISHRAGDNPDAPPVHIVAIEQALDRRAEGARRSPYALLQEYLNRSDAVWGMVTNGEHLRLLRASAKLAGPTYLDFNLRAMVEGNQYSEFVLLYRLLHRSRLPEGSADAVECLLERYYQRGVEEGSRVRERLRDGVEAALRELGNAFLAHPDSGALREDFQSGRLNADLYYRQLLRLVYRLLFLFVVEERRLIFPPDAEQADRQRVYAEHYAASRLRGRCERYFAEDRYSDLWQGLLQTFHVLRDADAAQRLGLAALNGELFGGDACRDLEQAGCENAKLLAAIRQLSTFYDNRARRRVNYAALDVEELGSVYESLLDYRPHVTDDNPPRFELLAGSERKQTGSYYTPPELVHELIESALAPVMTERLAAAKTAEEKEKALLGLRICDPASGSGHFLLAAARRVGRELARARSGEEEPPPDVYRAAVRDVIRSCIYAVDKNPLAVDLCKVALWLESHNAGLPLSFLDHHVKCGDSLVGVFNLKVLREGIPDGAYTPVTGDDKQAATYYRRRNKAEREGQQTLDVALAAATARVDPRTLAAEFDTLAELDDRTPSDVHAKHDLYEALRSGPAWHDLKVACDLWTSAFFAPLRFVDGQEPGLVPTTEVVRRFQAHSRATSARLVGVMEAIAQQHRFFHWPLEFPEVFAAGGFDVVAGNPPWESLQPEEVNFFGAHGAREIALLRGASRKDAIRRLSAVEPALAAEWEQHKRGVEASGRFIRGGCRFGLTAVGKLNTYALFAELMVSLLSTTGRSGCIVPTGIATDDTTRLFFQDIVERHVLVSLYDFENKLGIFPAVAPVVKFCLLTVTGRARTVAAGADFVYFALRVADLRDPERRFSLTRAELALLNPNTRTCPIFRSWRDAELAKGIYQRVPVLLREGSEGSDRWKVELRQGLFNMTSDSGLFHTREQLEADGWRLRGNVFGRDGDQCLPLYEAKMFHQFHHRLNPTFR